MKTIILSLLCLTIPTLCYSGAATFCKVTNEFISRVKGNAKPQYHGKTGYGTITISDSHEMFKNPSNYYKHDKGNAVRKSVSDIADIVKAERIKEIKAKARGLQTQYDRNIAISDKYDVSEDTAAIKVKQDELEQEYDSLSP